MNLTEEQEKKILKNFDAILEYIEKEIQPKIPDGQMLSVEFCSFDGLNKCKLNVTNCSATEHIGYSCISFKKNGWNHMRSNSYENVLHATEIVLNWNDNIKPNLLESLENAISEHEHLCNLIDNFEV